MSQRILCPRHEEKTPSCIVYSDGFYHCFGCGAHGRVSEIGIDKQTLNHAPKFVEDVKPVISHIRALPLRPVRGLELPVDSSGFYIVWPDGSYYKRRYTDAPDRAKYRGPAGVPKPLFPARVTGAKTCIIVEGELNALSLLPAVSCDVVSPGGTGDFISKRYEKDLQTYIKYERLVIVVDGDVPGAKAGMLLAGKLRAFNPNVRLELFGPPDANDVLQKDGLDGLKKTIQGMGLSEVL